MRHSLAFGLEAPRCVSLMCALLLFALCWVTFFKDVLSSFPAQVTVSEYPDLLEFVWTSWRVEGVFAGVESLYSTTLLYAPEGASLLLHTICEGVLLPVTALLGSLPAVWRVNSAFLALCFLNSFSAMSLFSMCGAAHVEAFLLALLAGFSPFLMGHLIAGHLNFLVLFPLLEIVRALYAACGSARLADGRRKWGYFRLFISAAILPWTNLYYLYFTALLVGSLGMLHVVLPERILGSSRRGRATSLLAVVCILVVSWLPSALHLYDVALLANSGAYSADHAPSRHAADLANYLTPNELQQSSAYLPFAVLSATSLHAGESSLYVPFALLALLLSYLWKNYNVRTIPLYLCCLSLAIGLFFWLLSFGPNLSLNAHVLFPNPFDAVLRSALPLYPSVPARFGGLVMVFLLCAAASACANPLSDKVRWAYRFLLLIALFEIAPMPIRPVHLSPSLELLNQVRDNGAISTVVDVSATQQRAMYHQTFHHKPIVGGFLSRRPKDREQQIRRNRFMRWLRAPSVVKVGDVSLGWCALKADALIVQKGFVAPFALHLLADTHFKTLGEDASYVVLQPVGLSCIEKEH